MKKSANVNKSKTLPVSILMTVILAGYVGVSNADDIAVSGSIPGDVTPVLTGDGVISVLNNGAHVAVTAIRR